MCNLYHLRKAHDEMVALFGKTYSEVVYPEGLPNFRPGDFAITDTGPIIRRGAEGLELVQRRWSWPAPSGKPVFNYVAEGRRFPTGRCIALADGFYEFTAPPEGSPKSAKKSKWDFTMPGHEVFCIAGIVRPWGDSEAWSMLTIPPGPDVAPYHNRGIVPLTWEDGLRWLDPTTPEEDVLRPYSAGTLAVAQVA